MADDIIIRDREQLLYTLAEACEIEHNLMCCYLYAAWSLRTEADDGLDEALRQEVQGWQRIMLSVAIDEMAHLALAWNLLNALGGLPHAQRPNFPIAPGYHPAGLQVHLAAFSRATLQHFIFLERPEGSSEPDGEGFARAADYRRGLNGLQLMPAAQDFPTVGHLYQAIDAALVALSNSLGEQALFCGDPALQVGPALVRLPGLIAITDLASARQAIRTIVEQGEGSQADSEHSHFQRFIRVRSAHEKILAAQPDFVAARPAATNPVMRRPPSPEGRVWVNRPQPLALMDLGNAVYNQMLRLLTQGFASPLATHKKALISAGIDLMFALDPLARELARLRANDQEACNAGLSFATLRSYALAHADPVAAGVLLPRLAELAAGRPDLPQTPRVEAALKALAGTHDKLAAQLNEAPAAAAAPAEKRIATVAMAGEAEVVEGRDLTLVFDGNRCIHARFCVTGAPQTFLANVAGPWLHPDATPVQRLVEIAHACPSGAVAYRRHDGQPDEAAPPVNLLQIREAGPYALRAPLRLHGADIGYRATLCRCGASHNKPFCDGSHHTVNFSASGEPATISLDPLPERGGELLLEPQRDGPLRLRGNVEICSGTGRVVQRVSEAMLCRCGQSQSKPFCDGSHRRVGFQAEGE